MHFWPHHFFEALPRKLDDEPVIQNACSVNNAFEWRHGPANAIEDCGQLFTVGYIRPLNRDDGACSGDPAQRLLGSSGWRASSYKNEMASAALYQPLGDEQPQTT
jgi:hypothetical protein